MTLASSTFTPDASATASVLDDLALYGAKTPADEIDHRPLPQEDQTEIAIRSMVEASHMLLADTQLEEDLQEMLWSLTNIFHRRLNRLERQLDENECEQRDLVPGVGTQDRPRTKTGRAPGCL